MIVIREFYRFAWLKGWYNGDLATTTVNETQDANVPIDKDAFAHTRRGALIKELDRDLPKIKKGSVVRPFQISELRALLNQLGPRASERGDDARPSRNRLFCDIAWVVGLRLDEIWQLTTLQFLSMHTDQNQPLVDHHLIVKKGKGSKSRSVTIPGWLIEDAISYINGERTDALKVGNISTKAASTALFLSGVEGNFPGRPIGHRRLQQIVEDACIAIGLVDIIEFTDSETGEIHLKKIPRHSVHDLRHTFAAITYHTELQLGNTEPWKKIQSQLGHAHLSTTIDTYLRHVEIFGEKQRLLDVRKMIGI